MNTDNTCEHKTKHVDDVKVRASIAGVFVRWLLTCCGIIAAVLVCTVAARFIQHFRTSGGYMGLHTGLAHLEAFNLISLF